MPYPQPGINPISLPPTQISSQGLNRHVTPCIRVLNSCLLLRRCSPASFTKGTDQPPGPLLPFSTPALEGPGDPAPSLTATVSHPSTSGSAARPEGCQPRTSAPLPGAWALSPTLSLTLTAWLPLLLGTPVRPVAPAGSVPNSLVLLLHVTLPRRGFGSGLRSHTRGLRYSVHFLRSGWWLGTQHGAWQIED